MTGPRMSPVQTMALELLILSEQIQSNRQLQEQRRLALMDKDPELVKMWFPEWFPEREVKINSMSAVEDVLGHAMEGGEVIWEADESAPAPSPEEVEALLRQLSSGSVGLFDLADGGAGWE